jgi:hypothetical protein
MISAASRWDKAEHFLAFAGAAAILIRSFMGTGRLLVAEMSWRASADHNGGNCDSP